MMKKDKKNTKAENTRDARDTWTTIYRTHSGRCTWCTTAENNAIALALWTGRDRSSYTIIKAFDEHAAMVSRE